MMPDTKADSGRVAENAERARDYVEAEALIEEATGITAEADPHSVEITQTLKGLGIQYNVPKEIKVIVS